MDDDLIVEPDIGSPVTNTTQVVVPPSDPRTDLQRRQAAENAAMWNTLRSKTSGLPLAQTEAAVAAALRFQAQRQYQQDLAAGIPPAEALARSGPLMFGSPKQGTLGQSASFIRATTPRVYNAGGVLYRETPAGSVTPMTTRPTPVIRPALAGGVLYDVSQPGQAKALTPPPIQRAQQPNAFDRAEYSSLLSQMAAVRKAAADDEIGSPEFAQHQASLRVLQGQLDALRSKSAPPSVNPMPGPTTAAPAVATAPPPAIAAPAAAPVEVSRRTKDGRIAIFDANTKKFIRYAE